MTWSTTHLTAPLHSTKPRAETKSGTQLSSNNLKLLSFNIQVGIQTQRYSDYITKSWRHVLPHASRHLNLQRVAEVVKDYDVVALQEVDAGSLRSSNVNQVEYIAQHAGFNHWHIQQNRKLAKIAAHSNGLLSKMPAEMVVDHTLPGLIPGRGAMQVTFGTGDFSLDIIVVHLSLSKKAQIKQLNYLAEMLEHKKYFAVMGDMNCDPVLLAEELDKIGLANIAADHPGPTYPSWKPSKSFDQIVVSDNLSIDRLAVLPDMISDHLPIALEVTLPSELAKSIKARDTIASSNTNS
ncbi:MAG: endonuclease/exonuclease/phosphatase family protein [Kangiellaceae bacterium]|jgi:endonuclease/exonuclease/phosphatase family metal-dependent hydrolase|nr:endonuclease/exonuclease/phosphatase family protein [Kangiellaceae bacterium]